MSKIKITIQLLKKVERAFLKKDTIPTNDGLSRKELRALERKEIVKKRSTFGKRIYMGTAPMKFYMWELKRDVFEEWKRRLTNE